MKNTKKQKLTLARETMRILSAPRLAHLAGAAPSPPASLQAGCTSEYTECVCPAINTADCNTSV